MIENYTQELNHSCGCASLKVAYRALGEEVSEQSIIQETQLTEEGLSWEQMVDNALLHCYNPKFHEHAKFIDLFQQDGSIKIVCYQTNGEKGNAHFAVVKEVRRNEIVLADSATGEDLTISREEFEKKWFDDDGRHRAFLALF